MKRLFLLILIAFFCALNIKVNAQPTLTSANSSYVIGETFILANHNIGWLFILQPQIGANQIWNFSTSTNLKTDTIKVLSRAQAPFSTSLPPANMVVYSSNPNFNDYANYRYLEVNSSKIIERSKLHLITNNLIPYIESPEVIRFPFDINSSYSDTATSTYIGANNATCTYKEIYTVEAVGYGQLITPSSTYNQALQIRTKREALSDNCRPQMYKGFSNDIYYTWHVPGIHAPVFQIAEHTVSLGSYNSGYFLQSIQLGRREEISAEVNLQAFPNPATSEVTIQYALKSASRVQLVITDALGKEVMKINQDKQPSGNNTQKLDVSKLPKGVYFVQLKPEEGATVKRLLIQ